MRLLLLHLAVSKKRKPKIPGKVYEAFTIHWKPLHFGSEVSEENTSNVEENERDLTYQRRFALT